MERLTLNRNSNTSLSFYLVCLFYQQHFRHTYGLKAHDRIVSMKETICIFSANYLPNIGGVEKYTQNIALALENLGKRVIIVTNNCFDLADSENISENIKIYRLPCYPLFNGRLPLPKRNKKFKKLLVQLKNESIDYISINARFYPHTFIGVKLAEQKNIRPIVTDHGSAYLTFGSSIIDIFVKAWEHSVTWLLRRHDIDYYGVSSASEKWLETFNIDACGVIYNAIDVDSFIESSSGRSFKTELNLSEDSFMVSFTGRFIPEKGIVPLINAAKLLEEEKDIHFLLAGDGTLLDYINANKTSNVHLVGRLDSSDISAMLLESDAFCSPSRSEGFSTSMLEAAACAATPIITNVGGVKELIGRNKRGIILDTTEPSEIAKAIQTLSINRAACFQMGKEAQRFTKNNFSWNKTALTLIESCKRAQISKKNK
ncbi:MAG: glycosyltransferase family 4 protein [Anaerotardibacter sp.]